MDAYKCLMIPICHYFSQFFLGREIWVDRKRGRGVLVVSVMRVEFFFIDPYTQQFRGQRRLEF